MPAVVIRMLADTEAVRAFGRATDAQAAELVAVAGRLSCTPIPADLGPVAAKFLAALAEAVAAASRAVAALAECAGAGAVTAEASAQRYEAAGERGASRLVRQV